MKYRKPLWTETRSSVLRQIRDPENHAAWEQFFDQYAHYIFILARRSGLQEADADDLVQTVLVELAQKIQALEYDRRKGKFRTWLAACARHRIADMLRAKYRRGAHEIGGFDRSETRTDYFMRQADPGPDQFQKMADEEWAALIMDRALRATREAVSAAQFSLFHAYVMEHWPVERVMKTYGVSRDQIYQAKRRVGKVYAAAASKAQRDLEKPAIPQ